MPESACAKLRLIRLARQVEQREGAVQVRPHDRSKYNVRKTADFGSRPRGFTPV
jgi:hypothetical protein